MVYNNGYYYYKCKLKPGETTSSFIESVTFNPKVSLGDTSPNETPTAGCIYNTNKLEGKNNTCCFLSPYQFNSTYVLTSSIGRTLDCVYLSDEYDVQESLGVRPVLYLSSNVKITDGTGEKNSPYKFGL